MNDENYFRKNGIIKPQDLLKFMNEDIIYGWQDKNGEFHNNMKNFRSLYITASTEEVIKSGYGTCIEQTLLEKAYMDEMGIPCKAFSLRDYRIREDKDDEVLMHCFLLFFADNKCYHFEHSNPIMRGIHEYENEEFAMKYLMDYYKERSGGYDRDLNELNEIPVGISFEEVNNYLDNLYIKK